MREARKEFKGFVRARTGAKVAVASALASTTVLTALVALPKAASAETHTNENEIARQLQAIAPGSTAWGTPSEPNKTLVLYDVTGPWGYLGQMYAILAGNLATHGGMVVAQPATDYVAGEASKFNLVIYVGSTYNEPLPQAMITDVTTTSTPVLWLGENAWELDNSSASATTAFEAKYGWDPSTSYFDGDNITSVSYKGETINRNVLAGSVIGDNITNPAMVNVLAMANCSSSTGTAVACQSQARANGNSSFPYAIQSSNITFVGENPLSYIAENDRYLVLADLIDATLLPNASSHRALVRLEDVNVNDSTTQLLAVARYLNSQHIPFSINLIPHWLDPLGTYSNGTPTNIPLNSPQAANFVKTLKEMIRLGGNLAMEGYTHQYSNIANPYDGTSADDFEFYRGQCSTTNSYPYSFVSPCQNNDWVIFEGPVPNDSASWASGRVAAGLSEIRSVDLPRPKFWVTPHYAASSVDYQAFASYFGSNTETANYDRRLYFSGQLSNPATPNYNELVGQFFPYTVHDLYGTTVIPENLGDYEPVMLNNHPPRLPADIVAEAKANLVVRDGFASFFYDPSYGTTPLTEIVNGIKSLGYNFVSPTTLLGQSSTTTF
ncbi:MAG: DUF2334 domain-containing protein [Actinomycetota bacterium]|jgi:uncharacterized protein YdaL|nr:DUF2334 domain-containing protein [Actinomycetota bacterium]